VKRLANATLVCLSLVAALLPACDGRVNHLGDGRGGQAGNAGDGGPMDVGPDALACPHAQIAANEVLWIGDSWMLVPTGVLRGAVRDQARAAGAIGPSDDYRSAAVAATAISAIAGQYSGQEAGATKVKVLIMDGGTWDTITSGTSDATVNAVASTFAQLLGKIASDGTVEQVVYFLPPELSMIPGVSALRPRVLEACAASAVPCHFIDLQAVWLAHAGESLDTGLLPNDAGAHLVADAIWSTMQQNCIAQ